MDAAIKHDSSAQQLLTFRLAQECYGVDLLEVKEIRGWSPVTAIPESPPFVLGMLNLRGKIVPVIDMRARFGMSTETPTALTVIIVLATMLDDGGHREFGLVVDSVSDVVHLDRNTVRPVPDRLGSECLAGLVEHQSDLLLLLDVKKLVASN
jgi:purine-binding chemotaxis protein CheW